MDAKEWVLANKVKSIATLVVSLIPLIVAPVSFVAWSAEQTAQQILESELIQKGRAEAVQTQQSQELAKQSAKHDYDFYDLRAMQAEQELLDLERDQDDGVQLTASQQRKMRRLEDQVEEFAKGKQEALERLAEVENENETTPD